jgi:hypothetical protein
MLLMVLLVMALDRAWNRRRTSDAILAGLIGGVLSLAMPDILAYLLLFAGAAIVALHQGAPRFRIAFLVVFTALLVIAPWSARNWTRFHTICLVSSNGGFNFYMGNNPMTHHEVDYTSIVTLDKNLGGALARADEFERDRILRREGIRFIIQNPGETTTNFLERSAIHWGFRRENVTALLGAFGSNATAQPGFVLYIWIYLLSYVAVLIPALLGFLRARPRLRELAPIWLAFLYSTAVAALFVVQTKMRLIKVEPFLLLFAAYAVVGLASPSASGSADSKLGLTDSRPSTHS